MHIPGESITLTNLSKMVVLHEPVRADSFLLFLLSLLSNETQPKIGTH